MIDFETAKPREIEGYLRDTIRKTLGDKLENQSIVTASRGYYSVYVQLPNRKFVDFQNFRRGDAPLIAKIIRKLK